MAWETEKASIENYYANLLIIQYRNKPKARATIKLGVDLYLADGLVFDLQNVLDIDTAQGVQLDLIGKILGCSRNIFGFTLNKKFFSFEKTNAYGFSDKYHLSEGLWKSYKTSTASAFGLEDADYRLLLKFKALYNLRRGSWGDMDELYYRAFGDDVKIINTKDLSIAYAVSNSASVACRVAQFLGYIEPPLGIDYTTITGKNYFIWAEPIENTNLGNYAWQDLVFANNKLLALSSSGYISTSIDGINWTIATQNADLNSHNWQSIVYANDIYVAKGQYTYVATSTDGTSWNIAQDGNFGLNTDWRSIAYGNNKFIILDTAGYISTSIDGTTWTVATQSADLGSHNWRSIVYGNGKFLAIGSTGYVSTSIDGETWATASSNADLGSHGWRKVIYDGTNFVAIGSGGYIAISSDGTNWTTQSTNLNSHSWSALTFDNSKAIAIGANGYTSYTL